MASVGTMPRPEPRVGALMIALAAIAVAALWPSVASLADIWRTTHDYQHGFLVALVSVVWLALVARRRWRERAQPSVAGALLLALLLAGWLVALTANSLIAHQLLLPAIIWAAIWAACGWTPARASTAPVAYFYFAMPVWDYALPVLQWLSVSVTETLLHAVGIAARVQEYTVSIPGGTFQIIEGCSGKRYFMVTLAVAVLAAAFNHLRGRRAIVFVLIAGALALLANWLRIMIVIVAGYLTDMRSYLVAVEHITLGNVIFVMLLAIVFLIARRMAPRAPASGSPATENFPAVPTPAAASPWGAILPLALLALTFAATRARATTSSVDVAPGELPLATSTWQGPLPARAAWAPAFPGAVGERRAAYVSAAGAHPGVVEIYIGTYGAQHQGRELVQYGNTLLAPGPWHRAWPQVTRPLGSSQPELASFEAQSANGARWLLAYLYDVGGWRTNRDALAQLAYGVRSIRRPAPSAIVALAVRCHPDCGAARALASAFWDDMSTQILGMLPSERANR